MKKLFQELENTKRETEQENAMTKLQIRGNPYALAVDYRVSLTYKFPCQYNN
jgi:hypothetical protein